MAFPNIIFGSDGDQYVTNTITAAQQGSPNVGDQLRLEDGRQFRYSQAGGVAVVVGKLYQAAIPVSAHVLQTVAAAAVGAKSIAMTLGATAVTANQYENGLITVDLVGNAGFGYGYGIDVHGPVAASGVFTVPLKATVQVAIDTTANSVSLVPNRNAGIILAVATTPTALLAGVSVKPFAIGAYGWVCTGGAVMCLNVTPTVVAGQLAMAATTTGAVMAQSTATSLTVPGVGIALRTAVTASYCTIDLFAMSGA